MGFNCGIVGLPNVGKSTIFNALTAAGAASENFPFCTIEPNVGVVPVPDPRLGRLAEISRSEKIIPTTLEVVDIAGLVAGASRGEGLGNKFLGHIRELDAVAHVVRCFDDDNIVHVTGKVDPAGDIDTVRTELLLADLETVERRITAVEKGRKSGDRKLLAALPKYEKLRDALNSGVKARLAIEPEDANLFRDLFLITAKPLLYILNKKEENIGEDNDATLAVKQIARSDHAPVVEICGKIESEIAELGGEDKKAFLDDLGLAESGLDHFIREGYAQLDLITFFTSGPKETRAWTVTRGAKAPEAAGKIHSDFERGFIRAEVMSYNDMDRLGSELAVREKGLLRIEGKDYEFKDGDVALFRFNV